MAAPIGGAATVRGGEMSRSLRESRAHLASGLGVERPKNMGLLKIRIWHIRLCLHSNFE